MPRTLWWEDNQLKMIDQRVLPLAYEVLAYDDARRWPADHRHGRARCAGDRRGGRLRHGPGALRSPATHRDGLLVDLAYAKETLERGAADCGEPGFGDQPGPGLRGPSGAARHRRHPLLPSCPRRSASRMKMWRSTGAWRVRCGNHPLGREHPHPLQRRLPGNRGLRHDAGRGAVGPRPGQEHPRVGRRGRDRGCKVRG